MIVDPTYIWMNYPKGGNTELSKRWQQLNTETSEDTCFSVQQVVAFPSAVDRSINTEFQKRRRLQNIDC